jgi:hypothetical protein
MARTLPPLAELAERVAAELGGTADILWPGDYPSAAILLGDRHPLLLRDHGWSLTLSLPTDGSWRVQTDLEWQDASREIRRELAKPHPLAMADVVLGLRGVLERITARAWVVSFPGTPVPQEAWFKHESRSVGLFQSQTGVRIVVWVGGDMRSEGAHAPGDIAPLAGWLESAVADQKRALDADAVDKARIAALPLPAFEEVMAALKAGVRVHTGGGRCSSTYFWDESRGELRRDVFDEGATWVETASESDLREMIGYYAEDFRQALRAHSAPR